MQGREQSSCEINLTCTDHPQYNDVIFCSQHYASSHPGTILFNRLVHQTINSFIITDTCRRFELVADLIAYVLAQTPPGRFLAFHDSSIKFQVIDTVNAFEKIYKMLLNYTERKNLESAHALTARVDKEVNLWYRACRMYIDKLRDNYLKDFVTTSPSRLDSALITPLLPIAITHKARKVCVENGISPSPLIFSLTSSYLRKSIRPSVEQDNNFAMDKASLREDTPENCNFSSSDSDKSEQSSQLSGPEASTKNTKIGFQGMKKKYNITNKDILLGKGGFSSHHPGNKFYVDMLRQYRPVYSSLKLRQDKTNMTKQLVGILRQKGSRFMERCPSTGQWLEISEDVARTKVRQALRDKRT